MRVPNNLIIPPSNTVRPIATDTMANLIANYDSSYNGQYAIASDLNNELMLRSENGWRSVRSTTSIALSNVGFLIVGGSSGTYSQTETTITVTLTSHTMTSDFDGSNVYLTAGTGSLVSGVYTNFTYVDANTFTVTSSTSQTTSGNLGSNTSETFVPITGSSTFMSPFYANVLPSDQLVLSVIRKAKSSANTKTIRLYMFGSLTSSTVPTTNATFTIMSVTAYFTTNKKFYDNNVSSALLTASDQSIAVSGQLASANDWLWICPSRVSGGWLGGA